MFGQGYRNVLGMVEGGDPKLKHEFILLGAHYDHVGYGSPNNSFGPTGYIHNGADDNASGTSGVLEVMQAFSLLPRPPRRSILFAFWDGEEEGMLGSKHWARYPTVPLQNVVFAFNADMIGRLRNDHVEVYGARTARGLRRLVSQQNTDFGLDLNFIWDVKPNSDHYAFFEHEIPFLMLHTGLHENYHRPSDDAELINRAGMQAVSQLVFRLAYDLADSEHVPDFRTQSRFESNYTRSQFEHTATPPPSRLGVSWSRDDGQEGLLLTRVVAGSAADRAGFKVGDRIVEFGDCRVKSSDQFRMLVLAAPPHVSAVVRRPATDQPVTLGVRLAGKPIRVGISWDQDKADPATVILTRVVPGSPAEQAGLAPKDRVYAVQGESFADENELARLLADRRGALQLMVERHGLLRNVTLHLLEQLPKADGAAKAAAPETD